MRTAGSPAYRRRVYRRRACRVRVLSDREGMTREERINQIVETVSMVMATIAMGAMAVWMSYLWMIGVI